MSRTEYLRRHRVFATMDLDVARDTVAQQFCAHRLSLTSGGPLDLVHNKASVDEDVALHHMSYGAEVRITPGTFDDFYLVQLPTAGSARLRIGGREVRSTTRLGTVASPTDPVDMLWSADCATLVVYLRRAAVDRAARRSEAQSETIGFDPILRTDAPAVRQWLGLVWYLLEQLESDGPLIREPLVAAGLSQALITGLLATQPNSGWVHERASVAISARSVRHVVALLHERPADPWTLADLARAAEVSPRALQVAFKRDLGVSPLAYLRQLRLEGAHRELVLASAGECSVTDIAGRWGFGHLSRFAERYQHAYSELPSATLAR